MWTYARVIVLLIVAMAIAGCDGNETSTTTTSSSDEPATETATDATGSDADTANDADAMSTDNASASSFSHSKPSLSGAAEQVKLVASDSEYGEVLWDAEDQIIYAFELDGPNTTNCFGDCATDWPPVLTEQDPIVGDGLDQSKVGTVERPDGSLQVTYNGWPLYFYDEAPGEIRCHNVNLNGGLWWVVGKNGEPVRS